MLKVNTIKDKIKLDKRISMELSFWRRSTGCWGLQVVLDIIKRQKYLRHQKDIFFEKNESRTLKECEGVKKEGIILE